MWWTLLSIILGTSIVMMVLRGPVAALGWGSLVSLLFPCWVTQSFAGVPIDLRVATSLILLLANVVHPHRRITWSFNIGDWSILAVYLVHVISDWREDGLVFPHIVRAFGEWSIPYISGRLAVQTILDWRQLTTFAVTISMILSAWAMTESVTHFNIGTPIFGSRPADRTPSVLIRNDLKRAEGPTRHPIWFGLLQTLLLPWTVAAAYRGIRMDGPSWWMAMPICSFCGILATVSRGPVVAAILMIYFAAILCLPKYRKLMIIAGLLALMSLFLVKDKLLSGMENWVGKEVTGTVEIEGEKHEFTAASHRWLVFSPYKLAVSQVGLFGYGTERTATFPVNVPFGPDAKQTVSRFWSIDCEYLLFLLRFGWLGLAGFCAIIGTSIWYISRQSVFVIPAEQILPLAIAATLASMAIILVVEWMPHDYGFLFLWLCGAANGPRFRPTIPPRKRELRR